MQRPCISGPLTLLCGLCLVLAFRSDPTAAEAESPPATTGQRVLHVQCATVESSADWASADFGGRRHRVAFDVFVPVTLGTGNSVARVEKYGYVLEFSWKDARPAGGRDPTAVTFDRFNWEVKNKLLVNNDTIHFGRNLFREAVTFEKEFVPLKTPVALGDRSPTVVIRARVVAHTPAAPDIRLPLPQRE